MFSSDSLKVIHRGNKLFFVSLGCPRNRVDTEVMLGMLLKRGYEVAIKPSEADYLIINTCGFLQTARDESLETIKELNREKKLGAKIIATGCMVQTHEIEIKKSFPEIDYLLGSGDVENILNAVESEEKGSAITSKRSYLEAGEVPRQISTPSHYAYLKIAEGCKKQCAYCIIPKIKGPLKSKPLERIIKEFRILIDQGVKEVILIAQDLGDWGKDKGYRRSEGLCKVLKALSEEKGVFWIRLLYLYPDEITTELISIIKEDPRICSYLDIPLQHVNNQLLKSMYRKITKEGIIQTLTTLRNTIPEISIRTSLIVGFPGETDKEFEELVHFLQKHPLDHVGIFKYSQEPGSIAAALPNQTSEAVKTKRQERLAKVQKKVLKRQLNHFLGKTLKVLVEGYHPDSKLLMRGRHQGQAPEIDGEVIINDGRLVKAFGNWYKVKITDIAGYDLVGSVI